MTPAEPCTLPDNAGSPGPGRRIVLAAAVPVLLYGYPLVDLLRFSLTSDLYSHLFLMPAISAYLVWQQRAGLSAPSSPARLPAAAFLTASLLLLGAYLSGRAGWLAMAEPDIQAAGALAFVSGLTASCAWFLGRPLLRRLAFPLGFMLFMSPFPVFIETGIETFLQHGSAMVAHLLFKLAGTAVFAEGLSFQLPGITLQVAPECSGIHSSLALFITSVLTGHHILRSPVRRIILAVAVIPLALLRNGFRVFVIGELCVHMGPDMIHSYIHRKGGPIFFVLSLIPFFLLLVLLIRGERSSKPIATGKTP